MGQGRTGEIVPRSNGSQRQEVVKTDVDEAAVAKAELKSEIQQTRADMSQTVEAIEERLSPSRLKHQVLDQLHDAKDQVKAEVRRELVEAKDKMREATVGRVEHMVERAEDSVRYAGSSMMSTVRANPIPAALIGIGLAWLWMGRNRENSDIRVRSFDDRRYRAGKRPERSFADRPQTASDWDRSEERSFADRSARFEGGEEGDGIMERGKHSVGNVVEKGKQSVEHVVERAHEGMRSVKHGVSDIAHKAESKVVNVAHDARDKAGHLVDRGRDRARRVERKVERSAHDNPLAAGAVAFAIGAAAGLALPHTKKEDRLLGEAKDKLASKLGGAAREALGRAEETAKSALHAEGGSQGQERERYGQM